MRTPKIVVGLLLTDDQNRDWQVKRLFESPRMGGSARRRGDTKPIPYVELVGWGDNPLRKRERSVDRLKNYLHTGAWQEATFSIDEIRQACDCQR